MARRRYQRGSLRKRGKKTRRGSCNGGRTLSTEMGHSDGQTRINDSRLCVRVYPQAGVEARSRPLAPAQSGGSFSALRCDVSRVCRTSLRSHFSTHAETRHSKKYLSTINTHLLPAFGSIRLCEIGALDLQRFVLAKMHSGLGWESCDLLRNLMSKVFNVAKTWNFYAGENPASAVMLPEKKPVREKHVLDHTQIQALLDALREPCRTMVLLGLLTGIRIGEILGLRWRDVDLIVVPASHPRRRSIAER